MAPKRSISSVLAAEEDYDETSIAKRRREDGESQAASNSITRPTHRLNLPNPSQSASISKVTTFQHPYQLISFSYNSLRELQFNNSSLNYYVEAPLGADLSHRYENWIKRPEERGRLDGLLEACLKKEVKYECQRADVVSWRGVMTKILTAPYEERDGLELNVMLVDGTMYLEEHTTETRLKEKESTNPRQRLQTYYGYAFESYSTSSTLDPLQDPTRHADGWSGDVNTNVQWCSVVKTKLGDLRLLIGGEVDCVRGKYTGQPDTFVELKTSLAIRNGQDEARFEKKLLKFYFQSFLLGVPEIVVGFRSHEGRIKTIQSFQTIQIPRMVRGKPGAWDPNVCLDWGYRFLAFLKSVMTHTKDLNHDAKQSESKSQDTENVTMQEKVWRVIFRPRMGVEVYVLDEEDVEEVRNGEDRVGFLPRSYWEKINICNETARPLNEENAKQPTVVPTAKKTHTVNGFVL